MTDENMYAKLKNKMKGQEVKDLLDYDFKVLAISFNRMINDYNYAVYQQDEAFNFNSVCDNKFAASTIKKILADKKYYKNKKVSLVCKNIECVKETFETIKFISDMDIKYHIKVMYERTNELTGETVKNVKEYDEILSFKNYEEGWKISKVKEQTNLVHNMDNQ